MTHRKKVQPRLLINSSGQALLVVVLLVVVVLTVGLSLAARSITNVRQSDEEDNSQRAFSAAEAGIELALSNTRQSFDGEFEEGTTFSVSKQAVSSPEYIVNNGSVVEMNDAVDVWLAPYPSYLPTYNGNIIISFGDVDEGVRCNQAALAITLIRGTTTAPVVSNFAYDPCITRNNSFQVVTREGRFGISSGENEYRFQIPLTGIADGLLLRIIPIYHNTPITVSAVNQNLPVQGTVIESIGTAGETKRKIVVVKDNPKIPIEMFPFVLFTPENL